MKTCCGIYEKLFQKFSGVKEKFKGKINLNKNF